MSIFRLAVAATVLLTLAGCATKLPTCDGNSRRPINLVAPVDATESRPLQPSNADGEKQ